MMTAAETYAALVDAVNAQHVRLQGEEAPAAPLGPRGGPALQVRLWVPKTHRHQKPADEGTCHHAACRSS
jgi:hypothetical protein